MVNDSYVIKASSLLELFRDMTTQSCKKRLKALKDFVINSKIIDDEIINLLNEIEQGVERTSEIGRKFQNKRWKKKEITAWAKPYFNEFYNGYGKCTECSAKIEKNTACWCWRMSASNYMLWCPNCLPEAYGRDDDKKFSQWRKKNGM